jgi:hypothetical protein
MRINFRPDGPHSDTYTTKVSDAFAEAVRVLNHATLTHRGLTDPATVYTVLGDLAAGASGLEQLLGQVRAFLVAEQQAGRLGNDRDPRCDPASVLTDAQRCLSYAGCAAAALATELGAAQSAVSGLYRTQGPRS